MNQSVTPLKEVIKNRRAVKKGYTNEEVIEDLVRELLADASWAPTHGMREPWRFVFVHQDRLPTFAREVGQTYPDELKENREAYLNEPNARSEEHTSELQSRGHLVCRLLLEKK